MNVEAVVGQFIKHILENGGPQIYISTSCVRSDHFESIMITHFCKGLNLCVADLFFDRSGVS